MAKSKKQKYLEAVWKLQTKCAKDSVLWREFLKKLSELNGGVTTQLTTPPPGGSNPPPKP